MTASEANQLAGDVRARAAELNESVRRAATAGLKVELETDTDWTSIESGEMPVVVVRVFKEV